MDFPRKSHLSASEIILNEREFIYPLLFYAAGLLLGALSFRMIDSTAFLKILRNLFESNSDKFSSLFLCNFALYISVFMVSLLLGMCLIGYPVINMIPLIMGIVIAIKVTYFYVTYSVKGIGYALLMIIPEASLLVCAILFTVSAGNQLSKHIMDCTANKSEAGKLKVKSLLMRYLIYASVVTLSALINSVLSFLLSSIIKM